MTLVDWVAVVWVVLGLAGLVVVWASCVVSGRGE